MSLLVHPVRLGDAIRPPDLRVGNNEEGAVLTSDGDNQNYVPPIVCLVVTSLRFPKDVRVSICCHKGSHIQRKGKYNLD